MSYDNEGAAKKFTDGIVLGFVIMGMFMFLQVLLSAAVTLGVMTACIINGGDTSGYSYVQAQLRTMEIVTGGNFMTALTVLVTAVSTVFSVGFYWAAWGRKRTAGDRQHLKKTILHAKPVAMICIASFGLYYLALLLSMAVAVVSPETMEKYNDLMESTLGGSQILAMAAAVLLAPVNEECIMRGLVLKNLQRFFSEPVVIILQAVMFGIFHANWVQGIYVLPVGAALGWLAVKSRSVLPCIFMHLFYNLLSFVTALLPGFCQTFGFAILAVTVCGAAVFVMGKGGKDNSLWADNS